MPQKAIVISNCQCFPLACALTAMSADTVFDYWAVHLADGKDRAETIAAFVAGVKHTYDLVLTIPLSDQYLDLSTNRVRATFSGLPIVFISNIVFSGFHPDLCYIFEGNRVVQGALGDYHSRVALYGFLKGMDEKSTALLFSESVFEQIGYFEEYNKSLNELTRRDLVTDIPVTLLLQKMLQRCLCFYSTNHPTSAVFINYAKVIVQFLESKGLCEDSGLPPDPAFDEGSLIMSPVFPIYPPLAKRHHIGQFGSYTFKPGGERKNPLSLERFLRQEFASLREIGIESLSRTVIARETMALFEKHSVTAS